VGNYILMGIYDSLNEVRRDLKEGDTDTAKVDLDAAWEQFPVTARDKYPKRPSEVIKERLQTFVPTFEEMREDATYDHESDIVIQRTRAAMTESETFRLVQNIRQELYDVLDRSNLGIKAGGWKGWDDFPDLEAKIEPSSPGGSP
jgi:hypothetical protein